MFALISLFLPICAIAASNLQVIELDTPGYPNNVRVELNTDNPVPPNGNLYLRFTNWPIGIYTIPSEAQKNMRENAQGTTALIYVNGVRWMYIEQKDTTPMIEQKKYFTISAKKKLTKNLDKVALNGELVIQAILLTSWGESIKDRDAIATLVKDYKVTSPKDPHIETLLASKYVLINEPSGTFAVGAPILIDFAIFNFEMGPKAHKVNLYVDGEKVATLNKWAPYQLIGLKKGDHRVHLIVVDPQDVEIAQSFGQQESVIFVH